MSVFKIQIALTEIQISAIHKMISPTHIYHRIQISKLQTDISLFKIQISALPERDEIQRKLN